MSKPRRVVLVGAPGSGKGTQAPRIAAHLDAPLLSVGDLLREEITSGSELGTCIRGVIEAGDLVPDPVVSAVVLGRLDGAHHYVLDGFPRTVTQAEQLWSSPARPTLALVLDAPVAVVVDRLAARGRADDTPAAVLRRLDVYREQTRPVLDWLDARGLLERVDASRSPAVVGRAAIEVLRRNYPETCAAAPSRTALLRER